jgi:hypothetical protein
MAIFFTPDDRYTLTVMTAQAPGGRTTVQLTLQGETVEFRPRRMPHGEDFMAVLPPIRGPRGALQTPGGGGAGPSHVDTSATLETDLDLAAVSAHYLTELAQAGWQRLDAGTSGVAAWSAWSFTDKEGATWQALLIILQRPGRPGKYALTLRAEAEEGARQGGVVQRGWSSSRTLIGTQWHTQVGAPPTPPREPKAPEPEE